MGGVLRTKSAKVTRSTCWWVRGRCKCGYSYGNACVQRSDVARTNLFSDIMEELTELVFETLCPDLPEERYPNSANVNLYEHGLQSVGWHADDERLFRGISEDCPIVSLSLGAQREFWLALQGKKKSRPKKQSIVE